MKTKFYFTILILFLSVQTTFPWGEKGHSLINKKAVEYLPTEMDGFKKWIDYLTEHASDADKRRGGVEDPEYPKHFIDIDFYREFLTGRMIFDKNQLTAIYDDSTVSKMGILPWATTETLNNLT